MLKRFLVAFILFVGVIIPGALLCALLAASAYPAPAAARAQAKPAAVAAAAGENLRSPISHVRPSSVAGLPASGDR